MLVARRDPFHPGAHDAPFAHDGPGGTPRLARTVSLLQVVGSLLAIPVGLASAYSIYRANFSVETTCQSLRADIIAMIDKRLDAGTRRVLVGRDVERFEQTCGSIDPDATAAFKTLLTTEKSPAVAAKPAAAPAPAQIVTPPAKVAQPPVKQAVRKAEAHPQEIDKIPAAAWPGSERREPGVSDSQWLDAVRQALVTHESHETRHEAAKAVEASVAPAAPPPVLRPAVRETAVAPPPMPAPAATSVVAPAVVPALPPAAVAPPATPATPRKADGDHPVPPGAIPDPAEAANADANDHRSRVRRWIAKIPLMGNVIDNGLQ
jgi:hypothetical protein